MSRALITVVDEKGRERMELDVPLEITAAELAAALDEIMTGETADEKGRDYLAAENPIAFLKGERTLEQYGIHNGTLIYRRR